MSSTPPLPDWMLPATASLAAFADLLADQGVTRGLIGPREVPRLWDRHVLNCAVVADPASGLVTGRVVDVGSGAGLPGLVWAIVRPDLEVVLLEPLLRRAEFLAEAVAMLGVGARVHVARARAEDVARDATWQPADVVTSRAVAPLDRLVRWSLPLIRPGGRLVALKGASAASELAEHATSVRAAGLVDASVVRCGEGVVDPPTTAVTGLRAAE